jgi:hypothetical protein
VLVTVEAGPGEVDPLPVVGFGLRVRPSFAVAAVSRSAVPHRPATALAWRIPTRSSLRVGRELAATRMTIVCANWSLVI